MFRIYDLIPPDTDALIWRLEDETHAMRLFKSSDHLYRVIEDGTAPHVFLSQLFIIVSEVLLQALIPEVGEQFEYSPVTIYDRGIDANITGYYRLAPNTMKDYEELETTEHTGKKIWIKQGSTFLFISKDLKDTLHQKAIENIVYVPGMMFVA